MFVSLIGVAGAFMVACLVDLAGNSETRPFSRRAFAVVVLYEMGFDLEFFGDVAGTVVATLL